MSTTSRTVMITPPLALYVHIPWCVRKCPYCDFNSHAKPGVMPEEAYIDALLRDLQQDSAAVAGRTISSIFIGGGTPSLFAPESIARLLTGVQAIVPLQSDAEITLEANPGTIERGRFAGYRTAGVNRVSLGVQSFNDVHLRALGRIHQSAEVFHAVAELRQAGLDNFNIDLMHGLPAQTAQEAVSDVQQAIDLAPTHLSWYQLTIEPNTAFHVRPPVLPKEDVLAEIEAQGKALLAANGYAQYEVSAYSQPGRHSRHNLNYWQFGDYLGIGAGAHAKITLQNGTIQRTWKHKLPKTYLDLARGFVAGQEVVVREQLPFEFMLNALRLNEGFSLSLFEARTGLVRAVLEKPLHQAMVRGLLQQEGEWVRPTELGARFLNDVLEMFQ